MVDTARTAQQHEGDVETLLRRVAELEELLSERHQTEEELRRSERKHRLIAENTTDYITMLTFDAVYTYASPSHRLLGYEPSELVGRLGLELVHPDDVGPLVSVLAEYAVLGADELLRLKAESIAEVVSFRVIDKSGQWHHLEATANLVEAPDGNGLNILMVSRDVTDSLRVEDALRQSYEQLEERIVERTSELARVNDELRHEIAERRRAEEAIRNSEEKFKILFEYAPDACYLNDLKGVFVDGNRAAEEMTGYKRGELIGQSFLKLDLLPSSELTTAAKLLTKNALGIPTGPDEFALKRKDGTRVVLETQTYPVRIAGKRLVLGIARDVTKRKQVEAELDEHRHNLEKMVRERTRELRTANDLLSKDIAERELVERALQESEEKLRLIVEGVTEGIAVIDLNGRIVQVNEAAVRLQGYKTRDDLIGRNAYDFVVGSGRARVLDDVKKAVEGGEIRDIEYRVRDTDGREFDVEVSAGLLRDARGSPVGLVASISNISERKRAEAELRTQKELIDRILATIPNAVLVLNRDSTVVLTNQAFYEWFQMERGAAEDRPLEELVPEQDLCQTALAVVEGRESAAHVEFRHRIAGRDRIMVASIFPMREQEVLLVLNDMTDERERQERMHLTDRLASVGEMAAGIAHELNNPLTSVVSLAGLLVEEDLPDQVNADIRDIYREAMRGAEVVRKLLAFSRRHSATRRPVQVNAVVDDVLKLRAYEHKVNDIRVRTRLASHLPDVAADYHEIQQVFVNIVLNAESAIASAHGSAVLTITSGRVGGMVRVSFADDGPGIPEENLSRVFDPFFTTKEVGEGTGLGLSICYGIVKEHGGRIYAESRVGRGAAFVVELPVFSGQ